MPHIPMGGGYWPIVEGVIRKSDILVLVIDARMPALSMHKTLEEKIERLGRHLIVACNKIDLISPEDLVQLKNEYPTWFFVAGIKNIGISDLRRHLLITAKRLKIEDPRIGIVGYPNAGKSAIINALAHRARTIVSPIAGTTKGVQWVKAGGLSILDSPGVIPMEDAEATLGIIAAKNPEKIKNPEVVAIRILTLFLNQHGEALKEHYKLKDDQIKQDPYEILLEIGKKRGYLGKGGIVDETKTSITIIREWQKGTLKW